MKSYKALLNEWAHKTGVLHKMTDEERRFVQKSLLDMYMDLRDFCKANNLTIVLGGGSCLGAIRHKGLIPWDDDLDLNMPRKDYEMLIQLLKDGAMSDKYEFRYPDGIMYSSTAFLKIYLKGSVFTGIGGEQQPYPCGLFLDIFPIEGTPSFAPWRVLKGYIANGLRFIGNCVAEKQFESEELKKAIADFPELLSATRKRRLIGTIFSFVDSRKWMHWFDLFVKDDRLTTLVTVPTGRKLYQGEMIESCKLFPTKKVPFEDTIADVYHDYDAYLKMMYGNYMEVPPVEKRECHFIKTIKLPKE